MSTGANRLKSCLLVALATAVLLAHAPQADATTCVVGSVSGVVRDIFSRPIAGAIVGLVDPDPEANRCYEGAVFTDA